MGWYISRRSCLMSTLAIICVSTVLIGIMYSTSFVSRKGFSYDMKTNSNHIYKKQRKTITFNNNGNQKKEIERVYDLKIIVMVFDRAGSLKRLLDSLNEAEYNHDIVSLDVWIDRKKNGSYDADTVNTAKNFNFECGDYNVNIHKEHVGIYGQWLTTYNVNSSSGSEIVVLFEDDISVSPHYYKYLKIVHEKYDAQPEVNGYSLNGAEPKFVPGSSGLISGPPNETVIKYPVLGSWGFSPNIPNWKRFLLWYDKAHKNNSFHPYVPNHKATLWYKDHEQRGKADHMWTIWHIYYAWSNNEYTIFSNFPDHQGLATNWAENGLHYSGQGGKKSNPLLQTWNLDYNMLPDNPVTLDIAGNVVKR